MLFFASMCFGLHWIPESMQRMDIRHKYNLQGSCLTDIAAACCCALCDLVQQEKESEYREKLVAGGQQYGQTETMSYGKQG
jgi:Cys-rich protein (TIGR01571 family)